MKLLVIDNYDSFTYNLVEYLNKLGVKEVSVARNDKLTIAEVEQYDRLILSPGPGLPAEAGILMDVIRKYGSSKKILGICLGHQGIAEVYGGSLENGEKVYHGVTTLVERTEVNRGCLSNLPQSFSVGRYHSWHVAKNDLPSCFDITAYDSKGIIMGIIHKQYEIEGIQFHPESVLTSLGLEILRNWINN